MNKEFVEEFKCPNCNASNYICWGPFESEREIPCLTCYGEDWVLPEEGGDPVKKTRGLKFICKKDEGIRSFYRDSQTLLEI